MTTEKTSPCSNCNGTGRVIAPTYLRELRQAYGLSLKAVAMRAGLSIPYISDLERGRRSLRGELAEELEAIIFAEAAS